MLSTGSCCVWLVGYHAWQVPQPVGATAPSLPPASPLTTYHQMGLPDLSITVCRCRPSCVPDYWSCVSYSAAEAATHACIPVCWSPQSNNTCMDSLSAGLPKATTPACILPLQADNDPGQGNACWECVGFWSAGADPNPSTNGETMSHTQAAARTEATTLV